MTKHVKEVSNSSVKKHNIKWQKLVKRFIARPGAYLALVIGASYGYKRMLDSLDGNVSTMLTILLVSYLVFTITDLD